MISWQDISTAPPLGTFVAHVADIANGAIVLNIESENGVFPIILVQHAGRHFAYMNMCPHQYLPLDYQGAQILSAAGDQLMCTAHGAMFNLETGEGTAGEGLGCRLAAVPLSVDDKGQVLIGQTQQ